MKKTVLITGATSGIGEACARKFAEGGYNLILTGRKQPLLDALRNELETTYHIAVLCLNFDVRDAQAAKAAIDSLTGDWCNIDVLINNAGLALGLEPEYEGDMQDWDIMIDTNIKGLLTMTRYVVPLMVVRNSGQVINIGSVAGDAAYAGGNVYCATKAAVKTLSDGLRIDVADKNIRVTNIKPGLVETNFSVTRFHGDAPRAEKVYQGIQPLTGADIADVAYYAASAPAHVQIRGTGAGYPSSQRECGVQKISMERYYCVAGHSFAVRADEAMLRGMENLLPFAVPNAEAPVFHIDIVTRPLPPPPCGSPLWVDMPGRDMPRIEVYRQSEGWLFRIAVVAEAPVCCELQCPSDFTTAQLSFAQGEANARFCIDNALMLLYAFRTAPLRTLEMHASAVVKDGQGFLFLGRSGTGKSTHARQWLQAFADARLLNDDNPILRVTESGEVRVYGSPWSGKTPCYKNESAPVAAIVQLHQAPENRLRRLRLPEAYADILSSASGLKTEPVMADEIYKTIRHIVMNIPCYQLECLPNTEAARMCYGERQ